MDRAISDRMSKIFFGMLSDSKPDVSDEDMQFFTNHLSSFAELMTEQAVEFLVNQFDVDERAANMVVIGVAMLNKMHGAQSFQDFAITEHLAEQFAD